MSNFWDKDLEPIDFNKVKIVNSVDGVPDGKYSVCTDIPLSNKIRALAFMKGFLVGSFISLIVFLLCWNYL